MKHVFKRAQCVNARHCLVLDVDDHTERTAPARTTLNSANHNGLARKGAKRGFGAAETSTEECSMVFNVRVLVHVGNAEQ